MIAQQLLLNTSSDKVVIMRRSALVGTKCILKGDSMSVSYYTFLLRFIKLLITCLTFNE